MSLLPTSRAGRVPERWDPFRELEDAPTAAGAASPS